VGFRQAITSRSFKMALKEAVGLHELREQALIPWKEAKIGTYLCIDEVYSGRLVASDARYMQIFNGWIKMNAREFFRSQDPPRCR
jgi:hypothetical protein